VAENSKVGRAREARKRGSELALRVRSVEEVDLLASNDRAQRLDGA
jgi:hypothetical protein